MIFKNFVDMHTHTNNSFDGNYPIEELCEAAIEKGIKILAFTDHVEMDYFTEKGFDKDAENSYKDILRAKEMFKDRIDLCVGIELGEPTYDVKASEELITSRDYDFVIGSIHNLRKTDDFCELKYEGMEIDSLLSTYFEELKILADWAKFDTFAHLTYPLRYIVGENKIAVDMSKYQKDIDEILATLVSKDKALEINTSGLRQPIGITMPDESIVRRFKELGGKMITVGSDSHFTAHMGAGIEEGMLLAKKCGFDSVYVFKKRQPVEIEIV